ncbi:MAG TPA: protease inhibitor I42 family protein [Burkholderiales bacterium]|nr:protease inhibitor I42 family protein [Burkholderiales bacterium]
MRRVLVLSVAAALAGCVTITSSSLGTFAGVMPCADCAGILTELRLYAEQGRPTRFELTETYLGSRDGDRSIGTAGQWGTLRGSADDSGATVVQLDLGSVSTHRNFLKVGEDELRRIDANLREIPSAVPHSLHRVSELPAVTLLETDSGRTVEVEPGQRVFVVLAANRATGFGWSIESSGTGLLTTLGAPIYARGTALGSEGTEMWFFGATLKGRQELRFQYRRPFEPGVPAVKTVSFTVVVS